MADSPRRGDPHPGTGAAEAGARAAKVRADLPYDQPGSRPTLSDVQLAVLRRYAVEQEIAVGDVLFADGDQTYDLIVILEGEVEIVEHFALPAQLVITSYGPREFLGEMGLLTGQRAYLTGAVSAAGHILRIPVEQVHVIMAQEIDLSEIILRAFLVRHSRLTHRGAGLTLVGSRFDNDTRRLLEVMARNRLASRWLELEDSPEAEDLLRELEVPLADLPIVVVPGGGLLRNPSSRALFEALGLTYTHTPGRSGVCDLLVVGAGPAGLGAAVYGASEGMSTTLAEDTALGGQAGTSSRIENYLGFPAGLSGEELAARAVLQAQKFGVRIKLASMAIDLCSDADSHQVRFEDGEVVSARSLIIATGAHYNRLPLDRLAEFEGVGVYYAATQMEALACAGGPVVIVGGGNSAGQAALFLASTCTRVQMVIRADTLAKSMSRYLTDQIEQSPNIEVMHRTEVAGLVGDRYLEGVQLRGNSGEETPVLPVCGLFVFIGAKPNTDWLDGQLAEDDHGFLLTGMDIPASCLDRNGPAPLFLETSRPGIFCVGDVRSRSVKRVATAIGEGSMAVRLVYERIEATGLAVADPRRSEG
jgi:thioredoxin reductase (NADPH)